MADVHIDEQNGTAPGATTDDINNTPMSTLDAPDTIVSPHNPVANPVTPGNNTMEKWQKFHVVAMAGSSKVDNLKIFRTGALGGAALHKTNARETAYGGAEVYTTPNTANSLVTPETMPEVVPAGANLGIGGALGGSLIAPGTSDFLVHQIQTDSGDIAGSLSTLTYQFDDTA